MWVLAWSDPISFLDYSPQVACLVMTKELDVPPVTQEARHLFLGLSTVIRMAAYSHVCYNRIFIDTSADLKLIALS